MHALTGVRACRRLWPQRIPNLTNCDENICRNLLIYKDFRIYAIAQTNCIEVLGGNSLIRSIKDARYSLGCGARSLSFLQAETAK